MLKMNLKALMSGVAALGLTIVLSWTFVDATTLANIHHDGHGILSAISALVR
jgi:hypothetical protein